ncbi:MAG: Na+/H+ antiporter subunit D [Planctomycetes bacterium]|nr:Na+/H+ antiporter subunit D [Planctomycetota bacterium]
MNGWLVLPIVAPLLAAVVALLLRSRRGAGRLALLGASAAIAAAGAALVAHTADGALAVLGVGGWTPPIAITLVADRLSSALVLVTGLVGLAVALSDDGEGRAALRGVLAPILLAGVCLSFLTGDLFNLYVGFEVMLMASFALIALEARPGEVRAGLVYTLPSLLASLLLLTAVGLTYAATGALNMADVARRLPDVPHGTALLLSVLYLLAFASKAALVPLHLWLPGSYPHTAPLTAALFSGLLTKVGVYALFRVHTLIFAPLGLALPDVVLGAACVTMLVGVLGAVAGKDLRTILSFHIVSQIGYMLLGPGLLTPLAMAGAVVYLLHHIVVKTALFLVSACIERSRGTGELARLGGLLRGAPKLAALFGLAALSLAGVPPFSGFWAKLALVRAGLDAEAWTATGLAVAVGLLTVFSMSKIWDQAFWKAEPDAETSLVRPSRASGAALLVVVSLLLAASAEPLVQFARGAAEQLLAPVEYLRLVGGAG